MKRRYISLVATIALSQWIVPVSLIAITSLAIISPALAQNEQSPIDIRSENTVSAVLDLPTFNYSNNTGLTLVNNGSPDENASVRADVPAGNAQMSLSGEVFDLLQFHFHTESEHLLNGNRFEMEMHSVHRSTLDNSLLVVGRWVELGANNAAFDAFFNNLPASNTSFAVGSFDLTALLPTNLESYRYDGSLTAGFTPPPFPENVRWIMLNETLELSATQIESFRTLFPEENSRPTQPLNGRVIQTDVAGFAVTVPEVGTFAMALPALGMIGAVVARRRNKK